MICEKMSNAFKHWNLEKEEIGIDAERQRIKC